MLTHLITTMPFTPPPPFQNSPYFIQSPPPQPPHKLSRLFKIFKRSNQADMESMIADLESNHQPKKRRKLDDDDQRKDGNKLSKRTWRTQREQQIYSVKLLEALRRTRLAPKTSGGHREIRETADRVLATYAEGRTRWSRAILASRIGRLRLRKRRRPRVSGECWLKRKEELAGVKRRKLPVAAERKEKVLSRLVPGCRKLSFRSLLDEASDYIAALEMQVRAMTTLAHILSG